MIDIDGKNWTQLANGDIMVRVPQNGAWAMLLNKVADGDGWTGNVDYASNSHAWFDTGQVDERNNPIMEKRELQQVIWIENVRLLPKVEEESEGGTVGVFVEEKVGTRDKMV